MTTIEQAIIQLKRFDGDQNPIQIWRSCIDLMEQIRGSLAVVQLDGAAELAGEILDSAKDMVNDERPPLKEELSLLTRSFLTLSYYFEYVLQNQRAMPALLIPCINDIRTFHRRPWIPESYFFDVDIHWHNIAGSNTAATDADNKIDSQDGAADDNHLATAIAHLRHMYQVGLLGVFKQTNTKPSIGLMHRAVTRIATLTGEYKSSAFWRLAAAAIPLFDEADLEMTRERKRTFGHIDRQLKQLHRCDLTEFDQLPPAELWRDLIYYIALSAHGDDSTQAVHSLSTLYTHLPLSYNEAKRQREQRALRGPNTGTVDSLVSALREELLAVKEMIEAAFEDKTSTIKNHPHMIEKMTLIKDHLNAVGLETASLTVAQQLDKIKHWRKSEQPEDSSQLLDVADALLYVEIILGDLEKLHFSDEQAADANRLAHRQVIVSSQFTEARLIVLKEIKSGLSMIKRALNAFSDSDFDNNHLSDIPIHLSGIRGVLILLECPRAAAIVAGCIRFIEKSLLAAQQPAALQQMMDTFADSLSGLEYYVECLKVDPHQDDDILVIAEESLAALGYRVEPADGQCTSQ